MISRWICPASRIMQKLLRPNLLASATAIISRATSHHAIEVRLTGVRRGDAGAQIEPVDAQKQLVEAVLTQLLLGSRTIERVRVAAYAAPSTMTSTPSFPESS